MKERGDSVFIEKKQDVKKMFMESVYNMMENAIQTTTKGEKHASDFITKESNSFIFHMPSNFFNCHEIEPLDVEIKFVIKR